VLRHQLGQDLVLGLDLLFRIFDPFLLRRVVGSRLGLEGGSSVLKELLLPAVAPAGVVSEWPPFPKLSRDPIV
jgi:hypothetical protein